MQLKKRVMIFLVMVLLVVGQSSVFAEYSLQKVSKDQNYDWYAVMNDAEVMAKVRVYITGDGTGNWGNGEFQLYPVSKKYFWGGTYDPRYGLVLCNDGSKIRNLGKAEPGNPESGLILFVNYWLKNRPNE